MVTVPVLKMPPPATVACVTVDSALFKTQCAHVENAATSGSCVTVDSALFKTQCAHVENATTHRILIIRVGERVSGPLRDIQLV